MESKNPFLYVKEKSKKVLEKGKADNYPEGIKEPIICKNCGKKIRTTQLIHDVFCTEN